DLVDARALLDRGGGDVRDDVGDALHAGDDVIHRAAGLVDQVRAFLHLAHRVGDQLLDFLGRARRTLRERTYFGGDDREAAALFAGTRGFDRGVERQDVRLERDAVDDADDVDDLARGIGDRAHRLH